VMESMERHCVAKYQHSADESTSQMLSEDGFRSFKDYRVEERGEGYVNRVQRKVILQFALRASCNQLLLARKSFLLTPKKFFTSRMKK